jgi:hypothetical protein
MNRPSSGVPRRKLLAALLGALAAGILYLGVAEVLYRWYEARLVDHGFGLVIAGVLLTLMALPGRAIGGYEHTAFWVDTLGYADQSHADFARRYVEFHVPIVTSAIAVSVVIFVSLAIFIFVGSVMDRRAGSVLGVKDDD